MPRIQDGSASSLLAIDAASLAARIAPYDAAGNNIAPANRGAISLLAGGQLLNAADYRVARVVRCDETGALRNSNESILLFDECEGINVDINKWIQTVTTHTITQSATQGILFNANSTLTANAGAMHTSARKFPRQPGGSLLFRAYARPTGHGANAVIEMGFGTPSTMTSNTAADGAHWRKDGGGQWLPVLVVNSTEYLGTPISNATFIASVPATDYALFTVELRQTGARFAIYTQTGALVSAQDMEFNQAPGVTGFSSTHVGAFIRQWNNGTALTNILGVACQLYVEAVCVSMLDLNSARDYRLALAGAGFGATNVPTTFLQAANYTNNGAPTTRTPSNTADAETTLGGHIAWNNAGTSFAASDAADLVLFGYTVPSPFNLAIYGVRIATVNLGAANGAAAYTIQYGLAVNHSAASLATVDTANTSTRAPRFIPLGFQSVAAAGPIGTPFGPDIIYTPQVPIIIQPGRRVSLVARVIGGSIATASQVIRTIATFDALHE